MVVYAYNTHFLRGCHLKKTLVVGQGGRESAIAMLLAKDSSVHAVMAHENPTIAHYVKKTGGRHHIGGPTDGPSIARFAVEQNIDLAFVSSDEPLAAGVVDELLAAGIRTVGPTRQGARIEWDKEYALSLMRRLFPELTPAFWIARDAQSLRDSIHDIRQKGLEIVVKPQGLTGGKGVKVMGAHLPTLDDAELYALSLLKDRPHESVILVEKIKGVEFTLMVLTDGTAVLKPPATYDYPYRFEGDTGPGTGGMGSYSAGSMPLPFMNQRQYDQCIDVAKGILDALRSEGAHFNGVLNTGFFVTPHGMKFLEFNARFGDPECMNIMTVLNGSLVSLMEDIEQQRLTEKSVGFVEKASVVKYLVSPEYALGTGQEHVFEMDVAAIKREGIHVFFSSATRRGEKSFVTTGNSRCVALATSGPTTQKASERIEASIARNVRGPLQWRKDIGTQAYIDTTIRCLSN